MPKLVEKTIKVTFYYEAYDVNYKHNLVNSISYNWNGVDTLENYISSMIESLALVKKNVFQYSVHEYTEKLIKSVSINKGVHVNEI